MKFWRSTAVLALLAGLLIGIWQFENIYEWWWLRNYQPSAEIASLADLTTMTAAGRREFYIADPKIDDKTSFAQHCPVTELSLVLGCYHRKIYILRVERPELAKVVEVTAAHEMLHAAYDELSSRERRQVNDWLTNFYPTVQDPKIKELVAEYDRSEPGQRLNELHSILPTQVASLSPELENYYKKYFSNRAQVVAFYKQYEAVFENLENRIESLRADIESLKSQIQQLETDIDQARSELEATNRQMDSLRAAGNISAYNALVPKQNAQVQQYNSLVSQYRGLVSEHNAEVEEINRLAVEQNQLVESLDSSKFTPSGAR